MNIAQAQERVIPVKTQEQLLAETATKKPVIQSESEWLTDESTSGSKGPSITADVSYDDDHIVIKVKRDDLAFGNSRPTSTKGRRMFCVKAESIPGYMLATNAEGETVSVPVQFSSLNFNLFASKARS